MKSATSSARSTDLIASLVTPCIILTAMLTTSCGSGGSTPPPPKFSGNTSVAVSLSSTANDQVTRFDLTLQKLELTNQSGNTVTLLGSQQPAEFMHLNGGIEPL